MTTHDDEVAVVRGFLATSESLRSAFLAAINAPSLRAAVERTWTGELAEEGQAGGVEYEIHGRIGCRFFDAGGSKVDFETTPDGHETFNAWRVAGFAESAGLESPDEDSVERACRQLAQAGELAEVRRGWFAVPRG